MQWWCKRLHPASCRNFFSLKDNKEKKKDKKSMNTTTTTIISAEPVIPPGFRFYPTEEELLGFYLRHRLAGTRPDVERLIPVVDLYSYHPRDLQPMAGAANVSDREQWFFFCPRAERELHGGRPARTTPSGYWKATGSPSWVISSTSSRVIGEKRTMVFYQGRAPTGTKTRWKMNEYKAVAEPEVPVALVPLRDIQLRNEFSVCRVYISTGTLRSFDRRPLNHANASHDQAAVRHHHRQQQQQQDQQQQLLVLPPPPPATTSNYNVDRQTTAQNSHDSSSSGLRGTTMVIDPDGIDWNSLTMMIPLIADDDGLSFSGTDGLARTMWP